jgi:hypothetical protein
MADMLAPGLAPESQPSNSLFSPAAMGAMQVSPDQQGYENFFKANYNPATGSDQLPGQWAAMTPEQKASYSQSQAPGATEQMPSMMAPSMSMNSPSFTDLIATQPTAIGQPAAPTSQDLASVLNQYQPVVQPPVPTSTIPPAAQQLVQQIAAPVTQVPVTPVPVAQPQPATTALIRQIRAPAARRPSPPPRPQPQMAPRPQPRPAPRPQARSVSRVNPTLLPSRPMGRR